MRRVYHTLALVLQLAWDAAIVLLLLYREDLTLQIVPMFVSALKGRTVEDKRKMRVNIVPRKPLHPSIDIHTQSDSQAFSMPTSGPHFYPGQEYILDVTSPKTHLCESELPAAKKFSESCVNAFRSFSLAGDDFDSGHHCDNGLCKERPSHGYHYCKNSLISVTIACGCITTDMERPTQEYTTEGKPSRCNYFSNQGVRMRLSVSRYGDHTQLDYPRTFYRSSGNNQLASIISTKREPGFFIE